jgi:hypothetical protein
MIIYIQRKKNTSPQGKEEEVLEEIATPVNPKDIESVEAE